MEWPLKLFLQVFVLLPVVFLIYRFWLLPSGRIGTNRWCLLLTYPVMFCLASLNFQVLVLDISGFFMTNNSEEPAPISEAKVAKLDVWPGELETETIELSNLAEGSPVVTSTTSATQQKWLSGERIKSMLSWSYLLGLIILLLQRLLGWVRLRMLLRQSVLLSDSDHESYSKHGRLLGVKFPIKAYCLSGSQNLAFTHWHCYFVSPNLLDSTDAPAILAHEATHAGQLHSFDLLVGELFTLLYWFHPFAWLLRREWRLNLEFLADRKACAQLPDRKSYLRALLAQSLDTAKTPALNFHHSPLKKRIEMLRQPLASCTRYFGLLALGLVLAIGLAACTESLLPEDDIAAKDDLESTHEFYLTNEPNTREWYELRSALKTLGADLKMIIRGPENTLYGLEVVMGEEGEDLSLEGLLKNGSPIKITVEPTKNIIQARYFYDKLPVHDQAGNILSVRNGEVFELPTDKLVRSLTLSELSERQQHWKTFHGINALEEAEAHVAATMPGTEIVYEYDNHKIGNPPTDLNKPIDHVTVRTTIGQTPKARISIHTRAARSQADDTNYGDLAANTLKLVKPHPELGVKYAVSLRDEIDPLATFQDQLKVVYPGEEVHFYIKQKEVSEDDFYARFRDFVFYCVAKSYLEGEPVVVNGETLVGFNH